MMNINKWAAVECGIEFIPKRNGWYFPDDMPETSAELWDIKDARCREIVKEHFKFETKWFNHKSCWRAYLIDVVQIKAQGKGKSIKEAEIACIQAIYEQRDK